MHLKVPLAPPQPKRALVPVGRQAVRVKKKVGRLLSAHDITGQVLANSGVTTARNQADPAAVHRGGEKDEEVVVGTIVAKRLVVIHTQAAQSVPQQAAVLTATAVVVTRTATVTTAMRAADGGTPNVPQTLNMRGGVVVDADDPGDISTHLPHLKTLVHVHEATVVGRGIDGTIEAALEVPAVGAAVPVPDPGDAATAVATVPPAAPLAPLKAPLIDEEPGVEGTATHTVETSIALASIVPSLHVHLHHEALTAIRIHRVHRC